MIKRTRSILMILGAVVLLAAAGMDVVRLRTPDESIHYHAAFRIWRDGQPQDFSALEFMHVEPCGATASKDPDEKLDLHDGVGDVVHVHSENVIWKDLLAYLRLPDTAPIQGFRDGTLITDVRPLPIRPDERLLIFFGPLDDAAAKSADVPSVERIREVGQTSETCGGG